MRNVLEVIKTGKDIVSPETNIIFNSATPYSEDINYDSESGIITLTEAGKYSIRWWVATETTLTGCIQFALKSSQGDISESCSPLKKGQLVGFCAIDARSANVRLSLVNTGDCPVIPSRTAPVTAALLVMRVPEDGIMPSFDVGEVRTLEPGESAAADVQEDADNPNNWLFSFGIPKGENGASGITPHIDADTGNWFIDGTDTGVHAQGMEGPKGETGEPGPQGETGTLEVGDKLFTVVGPDNSADMNFNDNLVFESRTLDISVRPGSAIVEIEKKSSDSEGYFIPFGTGYAAVALPTTNSSGASVNVVNMGFGECGPGHPLTAAGSGIFIINSADAWYTFTIPKDTILKGISMNVTNGVSLPSGKATISPYVVVAIAPPTSRQFTFVGETLTRSSDSFLNGTSYAQYEKTVAGESTELNVLLSKGTQVSIVFGINTIAPGTMAQANFMICSGGLWLQ